MAAAPKEAPERGVQVSVTIDREAGTFAVALRNSTSEFVKYVDGLNRYAEYSGTVPRGALIFIQPEQNSQASIPESHISKGYTTLMYSSKAYLVPLDESVLKPGEEVKRTFPIAKLAEGIYQIVKIDKNAKGVIPSGTLDKDAMEKYRDAMKKCRFRIRIRIDLDGALTSWVEGTSDWENVGELF
jgi:hypothetical protein